MNFQSCRNELERVRKENHELRNLNKKLNEQLTKMRKNS